MSYHKQHRVHRIGWLRAAVLGANDGIVSTSSLIIGVAAAQATQENIMIAGLAGLVAGAMSMAAGEYVSVSSQADTEFADLAVEKDSLENNYEFELDELADLYQQRGLDADLSREVAQQLMAHDALGAHARDELGIVDQGRARPLQAAFSSAITFTFGAALPLFICLLSSRQVVIMNVALASLLFLLILGVMAAHAGGASRLKGGLRVTFWGALAMTITAIVGVLFDIGLT